MEDNNNKSQNSYTGEYGNSVEGGNPPDTSVYSYSYKDGDNSVTHSGDYYAGRDSAGSNNGDTQKEEISPQETNSVTQPTYGSSYSSGSQDNYNNSAYNSSSYSNNSYNNDNYNNSSYNNNDSYSNNGQYSNASNNKKGNGGTGRKMLITVACAVLFGIVAGVCFEAVHYVSDNVLGITASNTKKLGTTTDNGSDGSGKTTTSKSTSVPSVAGTVTDVSGIVEQTMPAVVAITSTSEGTNYYDLFGQYYQQDQVGCGSGFIVGQNDKELLIATNNHVIDGAKTISVQFIDDEVYEATVKGTAASNDIAVIAVKLKDIKSATMDQIKIADLGSSENLKVGEMAIAIGNSLGYGQSVTVGYISAKDREITEEPDKNSGVVNKIKAIQTDAAINPGNSGGALLNLQGQVIGINSAKIADSSVEGVGYAIPISVATPIIDELMNKEELSDSEKGYLGVNVKTVTEEVSAYNIPNGVYIAEISKGGAADKAGLKVGDIITCINNMEVTTKESLVEKVGGYRKGTEIEVTFQRSNNGNYEEQKLTVKLQGAESLDGLSDNGTSNNSNQNNGNYGNNGNQGDDSDSREDDGFGGFFSNPFSNPFSN